MKLDVFQPPKNTSVLNHAANTAATTYTTMATTYLNRMTVFIAKDESNFSLE